MNEEILVEIDGKRYGLSLPELSDMKLVPGQQEQYQFRLGQVIYNIRVFDINPQTREATLEIDGQVKQVRIIRELDLLIEKMGLNSNQHQKQNVVIAPMPGLVTQIKVMPGDQVMKGTPLLILEAMKMENVIAAPHDATVKEIKVNVGQAVERGLALVEFESH